MESRTILNISGSLRAVSSNTSLLIAFAALTPPGVLTKVYDEMAILPPFNPDWDGETSIPPPSVARLRSLVRDADAIFICSPEYAHGVPGVLKNALDWLVSAGVFTGKTVVILGTSARATYASAQLVEILTTMDAQVWTNAAVVIPFRGTLAENTDAPAQIQALWDALLPALAG